MYFHRIRDLREDSDQTQEAIAKYLMMNREVYRRYETGEREIPVWALIKLSELYHTTTDYNPGSDRRPCKPCVSWPVLPRPSAAAFFWLSFFCRNPFGPGRL